IVVVADLGMVTYELNPRMPRRFFDPPPAASQFPKDRGDFRIFHEADWYGQEEIARTYFSTGSSVYWVVRNGLFPMTTAGVRLRGVIERDYDKTALLPTIDLTDSVWDVKRSGRGDWAEPFMAMSNAWYHGVYQPFADERKRVKGDFTKSLPVRFNEGTHWPRYYFSDQLVTIHDRADFAKKLSDGSYSRKVAFVARPTFVPARGVVYRAVETNNTAVLDVESFGQGFLVMSVTPHKYWRIEVTDAGGTASHRVPAITTNVGYQGIVVTPGRHIVRMVYRNELVIVGTIISLIATLALLFLAIRGRHPHVRPGLPAYEEAVHVVEDAAGVHAEAVSEKPASDSP
ncbi:MAG TPA: hypothetical protein VEZ11_17720, partial [Thermoanaerobaculia bacterium]|nr:hypothetical protein [Thermoanaerobaculia bacterium]